MDRKKVTQAIAKVGGLYKFVSLIERRTRKIVKSDMKPSGVDTNKLSELVLDEILEGKVYWNEENAK